jgi:hypothetical protein
MKDIYRKTRITIVKSKGGNKNQSQILSFDVEQSKLESFYRDNHTKTANLVKGIYKKTGVTQIELNAQNRLI